MFIGSGSAGLRCPASSESKINKSDDINDWSFNKSRDDDHSKETENEEKSKHLEERPPVATNDEQSQDAGENNQLAEDAHQEELPLIQDNIPNQISIKTPTRDAQANLTPAKDFITPLNKVTSTKSSKK